MTGQRRRWFLVYVGLVVFVAGVTFGVLRASGAGHQQSASHDATGPLAWLGLTLLIAGLLIEIAAFFWAWRTGEWRVGFRSPLWAVSFSERRRIGKQVRGKAAHAPEETPFLIAVATTGLGLRWLFGVFAGVAVGQMGQLLIATGPRRWFSIILAVAWLPIMATLHMVLRRTRANLTRLQRETETE